MTTEKQTQSTAGNNILSQVEYDAVRSHLVAFRLVTYDHIPRWEDQLQPGQPFSWDEVDPRLNEMDNARTIGGAHQKDEKKRIMDALLALFGDRR